MIKKTILIRSHLKLLAKKNPTLHDKTHLNNELR